MIELAVEFDTSESASTTSPSFLAIGPCLVTLYIDPANNTVTAALVAAQNEFKSLQQNELSVNLSKCCPKDFSLAKIVSMTMGVPEQQATWVDIEIACPWMADSGTWKGMATLVRQAALALA